MRNKQTGRHTATHNAPHRSSTPAKAPPTRAGLAQVFRGSGHPGIVAPGRPSGLHKAAPTSRGVVGQGRHNPKGGQTPPLPSTIHPIGIVGSSPITDPWSGASSTLDDRNL